MSIFFRFNNTNVNIGKIKEISMAGKDAVRVTFDDDSSDLYNANGGADHVMERFEKTIVQIIPCTVPLYNIYGNDDDSYFHERVCCLALCADGEVRSMASCEFLDLAEEAGNFVGCFDEYMAKNYPKAPDDSPES